MRCENCDATDQFVLLVDLALEYRPASGFGPPDWGLALQCGRCASTDVTGDPVTLLAAAARR